MFQFVDLEAEVVHRGEQRHRRADRLPARWVEPEAEQAICGAISYHGVLAFATLRSSGAVGRLALSFYSWICQVGDALGDDPPSLAHLLLLGPLRGTNECDHIFPDSARMLLGRLRSAAVVGNAEPIARVLTDVRKVCEE